MCYHLETAVSSVRVVLQGDLILCGFKDGSVRVFEMDARHKSDSQGCLLGYVGSPGGMRASLDVRVELSDDSKYVFAGARKGSKVSTWNLTSYRSLRKRRGFGTSEGVVSHQHNHPKLKGLGAASTIVADPSSSSSSFGGSGGGKTTSSTHRLACGLGISNLHVWNVQIDESEKEDENDASWTLIYDQPTGGNTVRHLNMTPGGLFVRSQSNDRAVRVWNLTEPWTKVYRDVDGSSSMGLLGFASGGVGTNQLVTTVQNDRLQVIDVSTEGVNKHVQLLCEGDDGTSDSSASSTGAARSRRGNKNGSGRQSGGPFVKASVINTTLSCMSNGTDQGMHSTDQVSATDISSTTIVAVALRSDGTVWTNYLQPHGRLRPALRLRGVNGDAETTTKIHLASCKHDGRSEPVVVVTDNRGVGGSLNVLRIAPLKYFVAGEKETSGESYSSGAAPVHCPLCRSDRDCHWEMSNVPSGCDDDDDLEMLQDSDSNNEDGDEDEDNVKGDVPQPPAKRQKVSSSSSSTTASASISETSRGGSRGGGKKGSVKQSTKKKGRNGSGKKNKKNTTEEDDGDDDQGSVVRRLEREVAEYKTKMREVCDSADHRFKEEKRLRKDWNKAQAQMQARASDAEERLKSLEKELKQFQQGGDATMSTEELTECGQVLLKAMDGNMRWKDLQVGSAKEAECVICCSEMATHAMVPCGHLALCQSCAAGMKAANKKHRCPMCKSEIQSFLKIFKP